ncbi:MAG: hypothetical protein HY445_03060 [Candidatus Niyogibacteria bacterium]|nr:hypothetical protein [Candidatus Niyogibacteria bacterium]
MNEIILLRFDMFFNLLGILLTAMAMAIVGQAAFMVVGKIRNGMLAFFWGLIFMLAGFTWGVIANYYVLPDAQIPFMVIGMILIFFFAKRLFAFYSPKNV